MAKILRSLTWASIIGGTITGVTISSAPFAAVTDPAGTPTFAAVTRAIIDAYNGVIITLTGAGNAQTIFSPTVTTAGKIFTVINNDTSTNTISVNGITIPAGKSQSFVWDGSAWIPMDLGITSLPVPINQGGTGTTTAAAAFYALGDGTPQNFIELISGEPPTIVVGDFNKVFIHSHASDSKTWNLPSVAAAQMGGILKFVKLGTGTMTIDAADADTIDDSAAGGTIYCSDSGIATISLQLVGASKWVVVAATNVWTTT
jgi:hypothetical protein